MSASGHPLSLIERNKQMIVRWFEEVWNQGNRSTISELLHADAVLHDGARDFRGPGEFLTFHGELHAQFANFRITPVVVLAEDDLVCMHWSADFRHKKSDKAVHITGTSVIRIEGGRFVEGWQNWDAAALQAQLAGL
jgi:predicted SnoaL-like aldol condensation-catalyzing enzyme